MTEKKASKPAKSKIVESTGPKSISFHYIKSNYFRVIHADGVYGGIAPNGHIQVSFFSERQPIPQVTTFEFDPNSRKLGLEIEAERVTRSGIVREIETNVIMDLPTAQTMSKWLKEKIDELEKLIESQSASPKTTKEKAPRARTKR